MDQNIQELENSYKRALADYQNLKRRTEEEKESIIKMANQRLILNLLEVIDDLEEYQKHTKDSDGIEKVVEKFKSILELEGVSLIDIKGDFDPEYHEALETVEGSEGKIVKVYRKGYTLNSKIIRPALVAVGKGKEK